MKNYLNITSRLPFDKLTPQVISIILPSRPEYMCFDVYKSKGGSGTKYLFSAKTRKKISEAEVSKAISEWIIRDFCKPFAKSILKEDFTGVLDTDSCEIVNNALGLMGSYEKRLAKKILTGRLAKYFENNDSISIDGFLRFRATELRRKIEELLLKEIDDFTAQKEYLEFITLLKEYVLHSKSMVDLLHIRVNDDESFSLYNFQKKEIVFADDDFCLNENDRLLSIILSINPKRIIWHDKHGLEQQIKLINTIQEVFGNRFSKCPGCELCIHDYAKE